jgi:hypothetical protein
MVGFYLLRTSWSPVRFALRAAIELVQSPADKAPLHFE